MVSLAYRRRAIPIAWTWVKQVRGHSSGHQQLALLQYVKGLTSSKMRPFFWSVTVNLARFWCCGSSINGIGSMFYARKAILECGSKNMKTLIAASNGMAGVVPARSGGVRDWRRWAPLAAVAWSLLYAALGVYWAVSGRGFPYDPETSSDVLGPVIGRFGPGVAWIIVMMAGIPAAAMGMAMLRGVRGRATPASLHHCRVASRRNPPAAYDRYQPADHARLRTYTALLSFSRGLHSARSTWRC